LIIRQLLNEATFCVEEHLILTRAPGQDYICKHQGVLKNPTVLLTEPISQGLWSWFRSQRQIWKPMFFPLAFGCHV